MTQAQLDFEITDVEPDRFDETDSAPATPQTQTEYEYSCEVCGKEIYYGGRGRKPKRCEEHKRGSGPKTVRTPAAGKWQEPLANALTQQFAMIGVGVYAFNQFDGQCIINGSANLSSSLVKVAETNPKVRDALQTLVTAGAWAGVATAVAAIAIPILQNHKVIPPLPFAMPGVNTSV